MGGMNRIAAAQVPACLTHWLAQCPPSAKCGQAGTGKKPREGLEKFDLGVDLFVSSELAFSCRWQGVFHPISRGAGA